MKYKAYEIRREILQFKGDQYMKALFVLLEYIDWNTGEKVAINTAHMNNWLKSLCDKHSLDWDTMVKAVYTAWERGWLNKKGGPNGEIILCLGEKPELSLIDDEPPIASKAIPTTKWNPSEDVASWSTPLTREQIRFLTSCPKCGAEKEKKCKGFQKGRNNREANHQERYSEATIVLQVLRGDV